MDSLASPIVGSLIYDISITIPDRFGIPEKAVQDENAHIMWTHEKILLTVIDRVSGFNSHFNPAAYFRTCDQDGR